METEVIISLWTIVERWGAYAILAILSWALWFKLDKKDKQIYEMIGMSKEIVEQNKQVSEKLSTITDLLLKVLISKDSK